MKIGFWQLERGHGCTTSNLAAIATYISLKSNMRSVLFQTHYDKNNLMQSFYVNKKQGSQDAIGEPGIDELIRLIMSHKNNKEEVAAATYTFLNGRLNLLYETFKVNKELYFRDLEQSYSKILDAFESIYDIVFVDIEAGTSDLSMALLEECDYVVCSLSQEKSLLDKLFKSNILDYDKSIFVLGDYDSYSIMSHKNIIRSYSKLGNNNLFIIPHCAAYGNSMNTTTVMRFINSNLLEGVKPLGAKLKFSKTPRDRNVEEFIMYVDKVAKELMRLMGYKL